MQNAEPFSDMLDKMNTEVHVYSYIHNVIRELKGGYTILV